MKNRQIQKFEQIQDLLRCPYCGGDIQLKENSLICTKGHCFDIASKGYVNLAPAQKALKGYDRNFFEKRRDIMEQGFYRHIMEGIRDYLDAHPQLQRILDAGCGEGYYAKHILTADHIDGALKEETSADNSSSCTNPMTGEKNPEAAGERKPETTGHNLSRTVIALDLAKEAVQCASRGGNPVCWLVSDLSRIPMKDHSIDAILNIFTPANYGEFQRLLTEEGRILKVIPGSAHMQEIREAVRDHIIRKEYSNREVIEHFEKHFTIIEQIPMTKTIPVEPEQLSALFDMTPLLFHVEKDDLIDLTIPEITVDACLLVGKRKTDSLGHS